MRKNRHIQKVAFTRIILLLAALLQWDCRTPFSTRDPEPPISGQSSWVQPTFPNNVMINLRKAIAEKNADNYLRCLADTALAQRSFIYFADASVHVANPGLFHRWDKESERNYLNQLLVFLPADCTSTVVFDLKSETAFQDSVILVQDYTLTVAHKQQKEGGPKRMQGQAELRLMRSPDDLWYIHRWTDYATGDKPTWSVLRAYFGR